MRRILRVLRAAFSQTFYRLWTMLLVNVVTLVLSVPCALLLAVVSNLVRVHNPGVALFMVAMGTILLPAPTAVGLHVLAREAVRGLPVELADYWAALRQYGGLALRVWLISIFGTAVIVANLAYYPGLHVVFTPFMEIIWAYILLVWLGIQLYLYPLIVNGAETAVFPVYRRAFLTVARNRGFTAAVTIVWVFLAALMTLSGLLVFLGLAFTVALQHNAARMALEEHDVARV
jgi:hypothetical protein